ncbi:MAG: hypothetical protein AAFU61_12180, partial [Pseudomonadota bacterium]
MRLILALPALLPVAAGAAEAEAEAPVRALPGAQACPVALPESREGWSPPNGAWTEAERWAWQGLCRGEFIDMRRAPPEEARPSEAPCRSDDPDAAPPPNRLLSPAFLRLVLTHPRWSGALAKPQVRIRCAVVEGDLDLENEDVAPEFVLFDSVLRGRLTLRGARFARSVFLNGSRVGGPMSADGMEMGG